MKWTTRMVVMSAIPASPQRCDDLNHSMLSLSPISPLPPVILPGDINYGNAVCFEEELHEENQLSGPEDCPIDDQSDDGDRLSDPDDARRDDNDQLSEPEDLPTDVESEDEDRLSDPELEPIDEDVPLQQRGLPGRDPPLYQGAPTTIGQSMLAILTFAMAHNLTGVGLADLLSLISLHCIATDKKCVSTLWKFKKYFQTLNAPLKIHYFCAKCYSRLNTKESVCETPNCPPNSGVNYFIEISILQQLSDMYKRPEFLENLRYKFTRHKKNNNNYEDIYDGSIYKERVREGFLSDPRNLSFTWNTDGVKVFKSVSSSLWPFYMIINELPYRERFKKENVIVAGLWVGEKPALPLFLDSFHNDLSQLYRGVDFALSEENRRVRVRGILLCGTCDLPAKAHMLNIHGHSGYYSCSRCMIRGERSEATDWNHAFPFENARLRTMRETLEWAQAAEQSNVAIFGIKGMSVLYTYIRDYLRTTSIDIMHCVYEGVMKKLLHLWFDEEFGRQPFSLNAATEIFDSLLTKIRPPSYVKRMPRSIKDLSYWKAAELKALFYYYSIPILFNIMSPQYFSHFLLLVNGVFLLNQDSISEAMIVEAEQCLTLFCSNFQLLYGKKYMAMNVHLLLHLGQIVRDFGNLWATSCMPLEDLNGQLKSLVHGTRYISLQISSSLSQVLKHPVLISKLQEDDAVRLWCEKVVQKHKFSIVENINGTMSTIGRYVKLAAVPPTITLALNDSGLFGNVTQFFKIKKGKILFCAESYSRSTQTCSSAIKFLSHDRFYFGKIHSFVRLTECNCAIVCFCPARYFAIVKSFQTALPFSITLPGQLGRNSPVKFAMSCTELNNAIAVPVHNLVTVCFLIHVNNVTYLMHPTNTLEDE